MSTNSGSKTVSLVELHRPAPGESFRYVVSGNETFLVRFRHEKTLVRVDGNDLVIVFEDEAVVILEKLLVYPEGKQPEFILEEGRSLILEEFLLFRGPDLADALRGARPSLSSGVNAYDDDPGALIPDLDRLGKLGTFYWSNTLTDPDYYISYLAQHGGRQQPSNPSQPIDPLPPLPPEPPEPPVPPTPPPPGGSFNLTVGTNWNGQFFAGVFEDGQPEQNTISRQDLGAPIPARLNFDFTLDEGTTITGLRLSNFQQGTRLFLGDPNDGGVELQPDANGTYAFTADQFDGPGVYLLPPPNWSGDMQVDYAVDIASEGGSATSGGNFVVPVDSVADLADANQDITGGRALDNVTFSDIGYANGFATQVIDPELRSEITFTLDTRFFDLDGSEIAWVDVQLPEGFSIPVRSGYRLFMDDDGVSWARIPVPDLSLLRSDGEYRLPVTLIMDNTARTADSLPVRVYTQETDTRNSDGHSTGNNTAVRVIEQEIDISLFDGRMGVRTGWVYEDNDRTNSSPSIPGLDPLSNKAEGASIIFTPSTAEGTELFGVTITVNPYFGQLYMDGQPLPHFNGVYIFTGAALDALQDLSGRITFQPDSCNTDRDIPFSYTATLRTGSGQELIVTGNTTVVIDAVADAAIITGVPQAVFSDDGVLKVSVQTAFIDVDGSERHFILVEKLPGWECLDPYEEITLYFDGGGVVQQPIGYDEATGRYIYSPTALARTFYRIDVTDQSIPAGGNEKNYVVNMRPPQGLADTLLQVGTLTEEKNYPNNPNGNMEYDVRNNQAFVFNSITVNTVNGDVVVGSRGAYEDHMPGQFQGDATMLGTDGFFDVSLLDRGDSINTAAGNNIVITFTHNGFGDPGSFLYNGVTYALGSGVVNVGGNVYQLTLPTSVLSTGVGTFSVRYSAAPNDDTDLTNMSVSMPVIASGTGATATVTKPLPNLIVDAVADKPVNVLAGAVYDGSYTAAVSGGTVTMRIQTSFNDFLDGSEQHYLVFDLNSGFASVDPAFLPPGASILSAADAQAAGLGSYASGRYVVVHVPNSYLQGVGGALDHNFQFGVDTVSRDSRVPFNFVAVAVDTPTDGELTTENNFAETPSSVVLDVHAVTSQPLFRSTVAFENNAPNEHIGQISTVNGARLSISGMDSSENITSMVIRFEQGHGLLYGDGVSLDDGIVMTFGNGIIATCTLNAGIYTITITGGSTTVDVADIVTQLSFVPSQNYSDADVVLNFSGTLVDNASGATSSFGNPTPQHVTVVIDAVAQQPQNVGTENIDYDGWQAAYNKVSVVSRADFRDTDDGSEKHYLLIEAKDYFDLSALPPGATLVTVGFDSQNRPLTPVPGGGYLNPYVTASDRGVTPTFTRTYIAMEADAAIEAYKSGGTMPPGFTVTNGPTPGSYTVSWEPELTIRTDVVRNDLADVITVGGMSQETAHKGGANGGSGQEGYNYNNTGYGFDTTNIRVAIVETRNATLLMGYAFEQNSPQANAGLYGTGTGAGILVSRTTPDGGNYTDEQITITFTFQALPLEGGGWQIPGSIVYNGAGGILTTSGPDANGLITTVLTLPMTDVTSILDASTISSDIGTRQGQVNASLIRFVPSAGTFNEADINLNYSIKVQDIKSGATKDMGPMSGIVMIDAVADVPVLSNVQWLNQPAGGDAYDTAEITLGLTVAFKDTGTWNGTATVVSEGQYVLVQQIIGIDLTQAFKDALGSQLLVVPVGNELYYRIPASFFPAQPGTHTYNVEIPMVVTGALQDQEGHPVPHIFAQSIVENYQGGEPVAANNTAEVDVPLPPLNFAVVDSSVTGGQSSVFENDRPGAWQGDYTDAGGTEFNLRVNVGYSLQGGRETASDIVFTYQQERGLLSYYNGTDWIGVPTGGTVPPQFSARLRFIPSTSYRADDADQDVGLQYQVTFTDPASGATKTVNGTYQIIVDSVAEKPVIQNVGNVIYGDEVTGDGRVGFGESITIPITARFPDYDKIGDGHLDHYILIEVPGDGWVVEGAQQITHVYGGINYYRVPVDPAAIGPNGVITVNVKLNAPPSSTGGRILYEDSDPLQVSALSVSRDPNNGPPPDRETTYDNNWAWANAVDVPLQLEEPDYDYFDVGTLYENNTPNGNQLLPDGTANNTQGGGQVTLPTVYQPPGGASENVREVTLEWDPSRGDLYVGGTLVTPTVVGGGPRVEYTIPAGSLGDVYFRTPSGDPYSDADMGEVKATVVTDAGTHVHSIYPVVDSVAQVPVALTSNPDYGPGNAAFTTGSNVTVDVSATFPDHNGNESHYVLVQAMPGWSSPDGYPIIVGDDGLSYFQIPVTGPYGPNGEVTQPVVLTPPTSGGTNLSDGRTGYTLQTGAMSVEGAPTGQETRIDNNTAFNTTGTTTIVTSQAESNPVISVTNTYAGADRDGDGNPNHADDARVFISGLNMSSDTVTQVQLTYDSTHGALCYNGVPLQNGVNGVTITGSGANTVVTLTDPSMIANLASGPVTTGMTYRPSDYNDRDVTISSSMVVHDNFSPDQKTASSNATIVVDAVAREAQTVSVGVADPASYNGAVPGGGTIDMAVTGRFPNLGDNTSNERHYLALQQIDGWTFDTPGGGLPPGVVVTSYNNVPYYVISIDIYGQGTATNHPYLTYNETENTYTFTVPLRAPESSHDIPGAATMQGGAVTIVDNPADQELNLANNLNLTPIDVTLNLAVVETTDVSFTLAPVAENSAAGSAIALSAGTLQQLTNNNEKVNSTTLSFDSDFSGKANGEQVGTIIYNGKAFPVIYNDGRATAAVDFGPNGYQTTDDFRVVWGTVQTTGENDVVWEGGTVGGTPVVTAFNHTGRDMNVAGSSVVEDRASGSMQNNVSGNGTAAFIPDADAPTGIATTPPPAAVGNGVPVSFTVTGNFVDTDGSERHYFLVEQQPGWTGEYQTKELNGVTYFMVPVPSNQANPTATVTLNTPEGITSSQTVNLAVGGFSEDGQSSASTFTGTQVAVNIAVVDATGVSLTMPDANEDGRSELQFGVVGASGESVQSVTISDLRGGRIVDANGALISDTGPVTLNPASGPYYYVPPSHQKGNFVLNFSATVTDDESGATRTFDSQTGDVNIIPVSNMPENPDATVGNVVYLNGNQARLDVTLKADFPDTSGTEQQFFVVQLPPGGTPSTNMALITDQVLLNALGIGGQTAYRVEADALGEALIALTVPEGTPGLVVQYHAVAVEQSTLGNPQPSYVSVASSVPLEVNTPPEMDPASATFNDVLRNPGEVVAGTIAMRDADGDPVSITQVGSATPVNGVITVNGTYGVLTVNAATGAYEYRLNPGATPEDGSLERFAVTLSDGKASAGGNLDITLQAPNNPPPAQQLEGTAGGTAGSTATGSVSLADPEGDAVSIIAVRVNGTPLTPDGNGSYTHQGLYGTFLFNADGTYTYTLTNNDATGVDILEVELTDAYGASSTSTVTVSVTPLVAASPFSMMMADDPDPASYLAPEDAPQRAETPDHAEHAPMTGASPSAVAVPASAASILALLAQDDKDSIEFADPFLASEPQASLSAQATDTLGELEDVRDLLADAGTLDFPILQVDEEQQFATIRTATESLLISGGEAVQPDVCYEPCTLHIAMEDSLVEMAIRQETGL